MRLQSVIMLTLLFALHPLNVQAATIRSIDFRNFTYQWYPSGYKPPHRERKVRLQNGEFEVDEAGNENDVAFSLANVSYADLTGDGKEEAIVTVVGIFNPNGSYACTFVYSIVGDKPTLLWRHETGDRAYGGLRGVRVTDRSLIIEQYDGGHEKPCMTCPSSFIRSYYRWNGRKFGRVKAETHSYKGNGIEFRGYPDKQL